MKYFIITQGLYLLFVDDNYCNSIAGCVKNFYGISRSGSHRMLVNNGCNISSPKFMLRNINR